MKTHEVPKANGSIRMHNHLTTRNGNNNNHNLSPLLQQQQAAVQQTSEAANKMQQPRQRPSIEIEDCHEGPKVEEMKFIDNTSCCDTPNLNHRLSVQISVENIPLQSPSSLSPTTIAAESAATIPTTIISLENEVQQQLSPIDSSNVGTNVEQAVTKATHDMGVDSAVEDSTVSLEQVGIINLSLKRSLCLEPIMTYTSNTTQDIELLDMIQTLT